MKQKKKFFFLLCCIPIVAPFCFFSASFFFQKHLVYAGVASRFSSETHSSLPVTLTAYAYDIANFRVRDQLVDNDVLNDWLRGVAYQDQVAASILTIARKLGINGRMRDLQAKGPAAELWLGNRWVVLDGYNGALFIDSKGNFLGIDDLGEAAFIMKLPLGSSLHPRLQVPRLVEMDGLVKAAYQPRDGRWVNGVGPNYDEHLGYGPVKLVLEILANAYYSAFGNDYVIVFSEIMAAIYGPSLVEGSLVDRFLSTQQKIDIQKNMIHFLLGIDNEFRSSQTSSPGDSFLFFEASQQFLMWARFVQNHDQAPDCEQARFQPSAVFNNHYGAFFYSVTTALKLQAGLDCFDKV